MANLVPIGRFSKMSRLSIKALRLYADIGLISPAYTDPGSGYRYYEVGQANRAEAVRILRSVDMPLEEIRSVLDAGDDELARKHLVAHRERLADRLAEQERMLSYLERLIEREGGIMPYEVEVRTEPPTQVAALRKHTSLARIGDDIAAGFQALMPVAAGAGPAGPPLIVYHEVIDEETEGDIEICIPVATPVEATGEVYGRELEGGPVASTIHRGPYPEIGPAYHTLTGWISDHGHEMAGPPREVYLNDPSMVAPEDVLTRVDWPIRADAG